MINKKMLLFSPLSLAILPLVVSCAQEKKLKESKKVEYLKNDQGKQVDFAAHIDISLEDIKKANEAENKENLLVGNFSSTDSKVDLKYSFDSTSDEAFFEIDNSSLNKLIYLKNSKFQEVLDANKEKFVVNAKASHKNEYVVKPLEINVIKLVETEEISLIKDKFQDNLAAQRINATEFFDVKVNLDANETGTIVNVVSKNLKPNAKKRISNFGASDNSQKTFYSPKELSEVEKQEKIKAGESIEPEIIFSSKSPEGTYVSLMQFYFLSNLISEDEKESMFAISYEKMDGKIVEIKNIEDTRVDIVGILGDPKNHPRSMRFVPIFEKVKKIILNFKGKDSQGAYPYVSEVIFRGQSINDYTQTKGSSALMDRIFATYLESNPLSQKNNVNLKSGDEVAFSFDPSKNIKLKQIQLYKAPTEPKEAKNDKKVSRRVRYLIAKYNYVIDFADNTRVILNVRGWQYDIENLTLPEKYQDKVVKKVTLIAKDFLDLKEIIFV